MLTNNFHRTVYLKDSDRKIKKLKKEIHVASNRIASVKANKNYLIAMLAQHKEELKNLRNVSTIKKAVTVNTEPDMFNKKLAIKKKLEQDVQLNVIKANTKLEVYKLTTRILMIFLALIISLRIN